MLSLSYKGAAAAATPALACLVPGFRAITDGFGLGDLCRIYSSPLQIFRN